MTHAGHRAYKKVDQRNRPCDLLPLESALMRRFQNTVVLGCGRPVWEYREVCALFIPQSLCRLLKK